MAEGKNGNCPARSCMTLLRYSRKRGGTIQAGKWMINSESRSKGRAAKQPASASWYSRLLFSKGQVPILEYQERQKGMRLEILMSAKTSKLAPLFHPFHLHMSIKWWQQVQQRDWEGRGSHPLSRKDYKGRTICTRWIIIGFLIWVIFIIPRCDS